MLRRLQHPQGDRERDLEEQLASDLPATDMAVYLDALYFRLDENRSLCRFR